MSTRRQFLFASIASTPAFAQTATKKDSDCGALRDIVTHPITTDSKTMRLALRREEFDDSDAYELAIADLIREHFARWIIIDSDAKTELQISGSKLNGNAQTFAIEFGWNTYQIVRSGLDPVVAEGFFKYRSREGLMVGSRTERIGMVRDGAYGLLSEFQTSSWKKIAG
jgi:hypothetical protein